MIAITAPGGDTWLSFPRCCLVFFCDSCRVDARIRRSGLSLCVELRVCRAKTENRLRSLGPACVEQNAAVGEVTPKIPSGSLISEPGRIMKIAKNQRSIPGDW